MQCAFISHAPMVGVFSTHTSSSSSPHSIHYRPPDQSPSGWWWWWWRSSGGVTTALQSLVPSRKHKCPAIDGPLVIRWSCAKPETESVVRSDCKITEQMRKHTTLLHLVVVAEIILVRCSDSSVLV